jgi:hypothetical protein
LSTPGERVAIGRQSPETMKLAHKFGCAVFEFESIASCTARIASLRPSPPWSR